MIDFNRNYFKKIWIQRSILFHFEYHVSRIIICARTRVSSYI